MEEQYNDRWNCRLNTMPAHGVVSFIMGYACGGGKMIHVNDAFVLSRVTTDMPVNQV